MKNITTLKELKKEFPELISTSGNNYRIDGLGWFKQKNTFFGLETYTKDWDGHWISTSFEELAKFMFQVYRSEEEK